MLKNTGLLVIIYILGGAFGLYHAWLFSVLWNWFLVPYGLVKMDVIHAYGLLLVAWFVMSVLANHNEYDDDTTMGDMVRMSIVKNVSSALLVTSIVSVGYFIHLYW